MGIVELYPLRGTFEPGETAQLRIELHTQTAGEAVIRLKIWHLAQMSDTLSNRVSLAPGDQELTMEWSPPREAPRGYGVAAELIDKTGQVLSSASSAFDVLPKWTAFPRYGFLTDFVPARDDLVATLDALVRFHINGLQFYDWGYRHDCLLPPTERYHDPLGRELSLITVQNAIQVAHQFGVAAMPYLAVYAASLEFWKKHPDWALYDENGQPLTFMDFLGLMDPTSGSPWISHLQNECIRVLTELPFDGLHVDQYGDPKEGFNIRGEPVDLPKAFDQFIHALKGKFPNKSVTFNAVGNWPIETLATSPQDFVYIEIWPPRTHYHDLSEIILEARKLSGGKPVVTALYLSADRPVNIRLADALSFSCGGARIELGERARLLSDPYFPKHQAIPKGLRKALRRYHDFAVRYGELFGPSAGHGPIEQIITPPGVWKTLRTSPGKLVLCLVNLTTLEDSGWDQAHPAPPSLINIPITIPIPAPVRQVWWGSPDGEDLQLQRMVWFVNGDVVQMSLPSLEYWGVLVFELED